LFFSLVDLELPFVEETYLFIQDLFFFYLGKFFPFIYRYEFYVYTPGGVLPAFITQFVYDEDIEPFVSFVFDFNRHFDLMRTALFAEETSINICSIFFSSFLLDFFYFIVSIIL